MSKKHHKKNKNTGMRPIIIKTPQQINTIRIAGKYLTELLGILKDKAQVWVRLSDMEKIAAAFIKQHSIKWAFKWYNWFPTNLCLSVNDCLVHGVPNNYQLIAGDLLKIDCGISYQWGIADAAVSVIVWWEIHNPQWQLLIDATKEALDQWLKKISVGKPILDYSEEVSSVIHARGFRVIELLTGHGVGIDVHEWPYIYNMYHSDLKWLVRKEGMVVAIEPITALESTDYIEENGIPHNLYTEYGDIGAQREYTIAIHADHVEILAWVTN